MLSHSLRESTPKPNEWRVRIILYLAIALAIAVPFVFFDVLMYTKLQTTLNQMDLWHKSSIYIADVFWILTIFMIIFTALVCINIQKLDSNLAQSGQSSIFAHQKTLLFTTCLVFNFAYLARCLVEYAYFFKLNYNIHIGLSPKHWYWMTWPGIVNDCLPIVIMATMHHINWRPEQIHANYVTIK
jgi:hypothetical protein